jgi:hypothetical protein
MFRQSCLLAAVLLSLVVARGAEPAARPAAETNAAQFMGSYRASTNIEVKLKALRALEKSSGAAVEDFLNLEYGKLDGTKSPDDRLVGGILRVWAARPEEGVLPYLIYEGLFHEDAEVVRACATGILQRPEDAKVVMSTGGARPGKDPAEALASDLVERLAERADTMPAIVSVLAVWSGRARPGFKADASLKRDVTTKEHAEAAKFWQGWLEQRFKRKPAGKN